MPAPLVLPLIAAGAALGGTAITALSARSQQRRQMRQDERFWHQQNEYNNPQNQMRRLQEAGLNPNLVYGGGASGAAGSAERLKTPDMDAAAHRWIDPQGVMSTIGGYADFEIKQAQTDNVKAQTQATQEQAILTAQRSYGEGIRNARTSFDLNQAEELKNTSLEAAREQLRKLKIDNQVTIQGNIRNAAQAAENIISSRLGHALTAAQTKNIREDHAVKQLDARMAAMGIRPTDPFYAQAIARIIEYLQRKYDF